MNRKSFSFLFLTALLLCLLTLGCKASDMPQSEATVPSTAVPTAEPTAEPILLGGQALSGSESALKLVLTADEMPLLEQFSALKELDLSGSTCYAEIKAYTETHPEVAVRCTVQADGQEIPNDAAEKVKVIFFPTFVRTFNCANTKRSRTLPITTNGPVNPIITSQYSLNFGTSGCFAYSHSNQNRKPDEIPTQIGYPRAQSHLFGRKPSS